MVSGRRADIPDDLRIDHGICGRLPRTREAIAERVGYDEYNRYGAEAMTPTAAAYPKVLMALYLWREGRSESLVARRGLKHVALNRAAHPKAPYAACHDVVSNILAPAQFSSFTPPNSQSSLLPNPRNTTDWQAFLSCCELADVEDADPTKGATHFYSIDMEPPSWADPMKLTARLGVFRFYRL